MPNERYKIFTDMETKEENIVDMVKGEPLTINQTCDLLNELYEENKQLQNDLAITIETTSKTRRKLEEENRMLKQALWGPNCARDFKKL